MFHDNFVCLFFGVHLSFVYPCLGSKYLVQCLQKEITLTGHEGCVSCFCRFCVCLYHKMSRLERIIHQKVIMNIE